MRAHAEPGASGSDVPRRSGVRAGRLPVVAHGLLRALRSMPFATLFAAIALICTVLIRADADDARILRWMSNVDNLAQRPFVSLVSSAFYIDSRAVVTWTLALAAVLALVERRYGTLCAVLVFSAGHVIASLITQAAVGLSIAAGLLPGADSSIIDVGVSYGFLSAVAVAVLMLPSRVGVLAALAVAAGLVAMLAADPGLTSAGHVAAFACGVGCAVVLRLHRADPEVVPHAPNPDVVPSALSPAVVPSALSPAVVPSALSLAVVPAD